jgi:hypothetical protein
VLFLSFAYVHFHSVLMIFPRISKVVRWNFPVDVLYQYQAVVTTFNDPPMAEF